MLRFSTISCGLIALAACGDSGAKTDGGDATTGGSDMATDLGPRCSADIDCNDGLYCNGMEVCAPSNPHADPRGCYSLGTPCLPTQTCDESMRRCAAMGCDVPDADSDGHATRDCGGDDCDDADPTRYPGNTEVCDPAMHDEDCDPMTFGFRDGDMDSYADATCCNVDASGTSYCGNDCNDANPSVHPGATETCNGIDDNCDGHTDEGVLNTYYLDCDADRHGERPTDTSACGMPVTVMGCATPPGYADVGDDCNDTPPPGPGQAEHPGNMEICDMLDNDCNGIPDDGLPTHTFCRDADGDGYVTTECVSGCTGPAGYVDVTIDTAHDPTLHPDKIDCVDTDARIHPDAMDACGLDLDCIPGVMGGAGSVTWYLDCDGDGHATLSAPSMDSCTMPMPPSAAMCTPPSGACMPVSAPTWTSMAPNAGNADCNDFEPTVFTGSSYATCDGFDSNCDGALETADDPDGDGSPSCGCNVDCAPANNMVRPGIAEVPGDGVDENCDGLEDCYSDLDGDGQRTTTTVSTADIMCTMAMGHALASAMVDCCDSDASAQVGETTYYTTADACGSFDYNCNGANDPGTVGIASGACVARCTHSVMGMCDTFSCVPQFSASFTIGWTGTAPPCGMSGTFGSTCAWDDTGSVCMRTTLTRTQSCR